MSGEAWTDALEAELTFERIFARHFYWRENPPTAVLLTALAIGFGVWEPKRRPASDAAAVLRGFFPTGRI